MEDYEIEEKKQAAADVMYQYSQFAMVCLGERVRPCDLRLHLMKEISGMPTSLPRETMKTRSSPDVGGEPSSSSASRDRDHDFSSQRLFNFVQWLGQHSRELNHKGTVIDPSIDGPDLAMQIWSRLKNTGARFKGVEYMRSKRETRVRTMG